MSAKREATKPRLGDNAARRKGPASIRHQLQAPKDLVPSSAAGPILGRTTNR